MATHSSVLAWRIPGTGEPGGLPSMGSHRVGHDVAAAAAAAAVCVLSCVRLFVTPWIIAHQTSLTIHAFTGRHANLSNMNFFLTLSLS